MAGDILDLTDANFSSTVSEGITLVDFYADWCGPCKMMTPVVEELATEFKGKAKVAKLDIDASQATAAEHQITSIPTLLLFKDGSVVEKIIGLQNLDALRSLLNTHV